MRKSKDRVPEETVNSSDDTGTRLTGYTFLYYGNRRWTTHFLLSHANLRGRWTESPPLSPSIVYRRNSWTTLVRGWQMCLYWSYYVVQNMTERGKRKRYSVQGVRIKDPRDFIWLGARTESETKSFLEHQTTNGVRILWLYVTYKIIRKIFVHRS